MSVDPWIPGLLFSWYCHKGRVDMFMCLTCLPLFFPDPLKVGKACRENAKKATKALLPALCQ